MPGAAMRIAVMLLAVVASATMCAAASGRPSKTTSAPPAGKKYISKRYGYSIVLKGKYLWVPAKQQWDGSFPYGDSGKVDVIAGVYVSHNFVVAAMPVAAGMTLSEWAASVKGVQQQNCFALRNFRASSLGGEPAQEFVNTCGGRSGGAGLSTWRVITLAALHDGRGYLLNYLSEPTSNAAAEYRNYDAGRLSFRFTQ
jgi:hypothetical protein